MPIEAFEFSEKMGFWEVAVQHPHIIARIQRGNQLLTIELDGFHVARSNETSGTNQAEQLILVWAAHLLFKEKTERAIKIKPCDL